MSMKALHNKKYNGSFTLEAVIVMSAILIILCAVFYAFMLLYQNVTIMNAASYAATEGAAEWAKDDRLYRHFLEFSSANVSEKKEKVKKIANDRLKGGVLSSNNTKVEVEFKNSWGKRSIVVEISQEISVPFPMIAKFFNGGKALELKAQATADIAEPAEYIRNIDYGIEWVTVIGNWLGEKIGENESVSKVKEIFEKMGF